MLSSDLAFALDPVAFAESLGITPDPWQADLLASQAQRALLLCSRQAGKSTTASLLALHTALYDAPALVVLISPSQRQSSELFRTTMGFFHRIEGAPKPTLESALRLELENGSRIIALPGSESTVRGYAAARLVIIDEASRVPDDLLAAVRPMLATTNGRLLGLTTPYGRRGWFYKEWTAPDGWKKVRVTADQIPRISPEFLEAEEKSLGPLLFRQEYHCEFVDDGQAVFPSELIERCIDDEVTPLWPSLEAA